MQNDERISEIKHCLSCIHKSAEQLNLYAYQHDNLDSKELNDIKRKIRLINTLLIYIEHKISNL